ncbi:hypothetical protein IWQ60_012631, partial [Tieghemiomyces parasiticus]
METTVADQASPIIARSPVVITNDSLGNQDPQEEAPVVTSRAPTVQSSPTLESLASRLASLVPTVQPSPSLEAQPSPVNRASRHTSKNLTARHSPVLPASSATPVLQASRHTSRIITAQPSPALQASSHRVSRVPTAQASPVLQADASPAANPAAGSRVLTAHPSPALQAEEIPVAGSKVASR